MVTQPPPHSGGFLCSSSNLERGRILKIIYFFVKLTLQKCKLALHCCRKNFHLLINIANRRGEH